MNFRVSHYYDFFSLRSHALYPNAPDIYWIDLKKKQDTIPGTFFHSQNTIMQRQVEEVVIQNNIVCNCMYAEGAHFLNKLWDNSSDISL